MKKYLIAPLFAVLLLTPLALHAVSPEKPADYSDGGVVLRFSGPMGSVLNPGEQIGFSFQSSRDAYVIVFNIDTEGFVHLLHPVAGKRLALTKAREWKNIPENPRERFMAEGETGIEFVFALTVPDDEFIDEFELGFLADNETLPREKRYRIDGDPFLAANIIAGEIVRGISHRPGIYLDYTYFYINERVDYPCYLCGECDGEEPDPLRTEYEITSNFDRGSPLAYPLRRAYELVEPAGPAVEDYGVVDEEDDDDVQTSRVHVTFHPYRSDFYDDVYDYNDGLDYYLYVWDPLWYDPWIYGWNYYPSSRYHRNWWWYPYGHYYTWTFDWGFSGGYYCSPWYYPSYYGWGCHGYYYYDYYRDYWRTHHYDRYKDKYKRGREPAPYKTKHTSLAAARGSATNRGNRLKSASQDFRAAQSGKYTGVTRSKNAGVVKTNRATRLKTADTRSSYTNYTKTTRVKNYRRPDTRTKDQSVDRSRVTKTRNKSLDRNKPRTRDTKVKSRNVTPSKRSYESNKSRSNPPKSRAEKGKTVKQRSTRSKSPAVKKNTPQKRSTKSNAVRKSGRSTQKKSTTPTYKSSTPSKRSSSASSRPAVKSSSRSGSSKASSGSRSTSGSRSSSRSKSGGSSKRK